jgi:lysozyme
MTVTDQIAGFEGCRLTAYPDPMTHSDPWTIGYGHTGSDVYPGVVWTQQQADDQLAADVARCTGQVLSAIPWAAGLNDARQAVLIGMAYQLGLGGLVAFHNTLSSIQSSDWQRARDGMLNSVWAQQTPRRAGILAQQMLTGEWPA